MNIIAYYKGFHVDYDLREDDKTYLPAVKTAIDNLIAEGFKPSWNPETTKQALATETPVVDAPTAFEDSLKASIPNCGIHGTPMVWKTGNYKNDIMGKDGKTVWKKAGEAYAYWSCPTRNADQSYCKFKVKE